MSRQQRLSKRPWSLLCLKWSTRFLVLLNAGECYVSFNPSKHWLPYVLHVLTLSNLTFCRILIINRNYFHLNIDFLIFILSMRNVISEAIIEFSILLFNPLKAKIILNCMYYIPIRSVRTLVPRSKHTPPLL